MDRAGKQQVLVVDDDQDIRDSLRVILEDAGYVVYEAPDGEPALQRLHESQARMVVLVDLNMPGMDGRQLLHAVAQHDTLATQHAYVVVTANEETVPLALGHLLTNLGASILGKPFDLDTLLATVRQAASRLDKQAT
jgi:CheY-like chemotaxis protein